MIFYKWTHLYSWDLRSSGILHSRRCEFLSDVSEELIGPTFKGQEMQDFLTFEDGNDRLSWSVGK